MLTDVERWPEWTASVKKLERIDEGPLVLGSRAKLWLKGSPSATSWTVTHFDEGRAFSWENGVPGFVSVGDHELRPDGGGTNVNLRVTYSGLLSPIMARILARVSRENLRFEAAGLKRESEQT